MNSYRLEAIGRQSLPRDMYQNLFDSHTHSENSHDGVHSVTFMVENAIDRDIQGFAVTDHFDCDHFEEQDCEMRLRQTALDVAMAKAAFRNRLIISTGIELGQVHLNYKAADIALTMVHYDVVLMAVHCMRGWQDFYDIDYKNFSDEDINTMMLQYFDELLELTRWGNFDVLAHLSLPVRYPKLYNDIEIDLTRYTSQIDEILSLLAKNGKALEINTSGLRSSVGKTMPEQWVVQRFRELGGEYVTIGSDAHNAEDIGASITDGMKILADCGFEYFTFYRDRKPVLLKLI